MQCYPPPPQKKKAQWRQHKRKRKRPYEDSKEALVIPPQECYVTREKALNKYRKGCFIKTVQGLGKAPWIMQRNQRKGSV